MKHAARCAHLSRLNWRRRTAEAHRVSFTSQNTSSHTYDASIVRIRGLEGARRLMADYTACIKALQEVAEGHTALVALFTGTSVNLLSAWPEVRQGSRQGAKPCPAPYRRNHTVQAASTPSRAHKALRSRQLLDSYWSQSP